MQLTHSQIALGAVLKIGKKYNLELTDFLNVERFVEALLSSNLHSIDRLIVLGYKQTYLTKE